MPTPMNYALRLLKIKSYYIKEMYNKLSIRYDEKETNKTIKDLIINDYLNDNKLVFLKMNYLINEKKYGRKYIISYFMKKNISYNLIIYNLSKFDENIFNNNSKMIIMYLKKNGKDEIYIKKYLLRHGYDEE